LTVVLHPSQALAIRQNIILATAQTFKPWAARESLDLALIVPGKPWQKGLKESFNDKFRDECLSMEWFRCRAEARVVIEEWRRHYNSVRPHSSLNNMTPEHFCRQYGKNLNRGETLKN
jgi:putative transposase